MAPKGVAAELTDSAPQTFAAIMPETFLNNETEDPHAKSFRSIRYHESR
jgi:hypothetical protein